MQKQNIQPAANAHVANAAPAHAPESGFFFKFPYASEATFIKHPFSQHLSQLEKETYAYEFLNSEVLPHWQRNESATQTVIELQDNLKWACKMYQDAFADIKQWIDKEHFSKILWDMLKYSITSEMADNDINYRGDAMILYEYLNDLSGFIFDVSPTNLIGVGNAA